MAIITIETPFNIELEFRIATFNKRLLAWMIDITIICLYYYLMLTFIYPLFGVGRVAGSTAQLFAITIPVLGYQLLFELFFNGQTIGKKLAGIKVIDIEGREPTWGQYITRWILCIGNLFVFIIPYIIMQSVWLMVVYMILYLPDFLSVVVSARSQRLGDFAAGTVVIDKNYRPDINETIYLEIEDKDYTPLYPEVMRLTDRDINGIRNLLDTKRPAKNNENYIIEVAQKIKTVLNIQSDLYPTDFLRQLLRDYNYYTTHNPNT